MIEFLNNTFATIFGDNIILATIIISMIPVIELRGAIPFATSSKLWGELAMSNWQAFGWSLLGSSAIVPFIALLFFPIINWLKSTKWFKSLANKIENYVRKKADKLMDDEKSKRFSKSYWKKVIGVFIFVAIPLPLTGVWTGTCVALILGLDYFTTCFTVILGNVVAGLIISLILLFFPWLQDWLFLIFLGIVLVILLANLLKSMILKLKNKKEDN